jgi:hypothetical protein
MTGLAMDTSEPDIARVYDHWVGGQDNDNRAFVTAVARQAAARGIAQFIDLGAGRPAHPSVHEAAREVIPLARVAYVGNDPVLVSQARARLATGYGLAVTQADLRDPAAVLGDPAVHRVIDLTQPVCVILAAMAHFLPAAQAAEIAGGFIRPLAAGSWLAISCAHFTDEELLARLYALGTTAPFQNHGTGQLATFLAGLDPIPPGIAEIRRWLSGVAGTPKQKSAYLLCGVAAKPRG